MKHVSQRTNNNFLSAHAQVNRYLLAVIRLKPAYYAKINTLKLLLDYLNFKGTKKAWDFAAHAFVKSYAVQKL